MQKTILWAVIFLMNLLLLGAQDILTDEERLWLEENSPIVLGVDDENRPMNYLDESGEMRGLTIDYMDLIGERLGIRFQYYPASWNTALEAALNHEVDGIVNASIKEDRLAYLNFTDSYYQSPDAILSLASEDYIQNAQSLQGKTIAIIRGSVRKDVIRNYAPGVRVLEVDSQLDGAKAVIEGRADGFLDELAVIQNLEKEFRISSLKLNALFFFPELGTAHIGVRNDDPMLVNILNKGIDALTDKDDSLIQSRYIDNTEGVRWIRDPGFTREEREWVISHPVVRVGADGYWAPMEFLEDGVPRGISIDFLKEISEMTGIDFQVTAGPWHKIIDMIKNHDLDMLSCAQPTADREEYLDFSPPFLSIPLVLLAQADISYIKNLNELRYLHLGLLKGYASTDIFSKDYPSIPYTTYETIGEAVDALLKGEIDVFLENQNSINRYLSENGIWGLQIAGDTGYRYELSMAVRDDWPVLSSILAKSVEALDKNRLNEIEKKWSYVTIKKEMDYRTLWWVSVGFISILILLLVYILFLSRRNRLRTIQLEEAKRMEAIGNMAGGVAHDFKNILMGISGYTELLHGGLDVSEEHEDYVRQIMGAVDSGTELANRILLYSRTSREEETAREDVALSELVEQTAVLLKSSSMKYKLSLTLDVESDCHIIGDPGQLKRIIMNLGTNAIQAMAETKAPELHISLTSHPANTGYAKPGQKSSAPTVELLFRDNGPGIPGKIEQRIFDPYFTTKTRSNGTGLGLALVQRMVENHQGHIFFKRNPEGGTTFHIRFPAVKPGNITD